MKARKLWIGIAFTGALVVLLKWYFAGEKPGTISGKVAGTAPAVIRLLGSGQWWQTVADTVAGLPDNTSIQPWQLVNKGSTDVLLQWQYKQYTIPTLLQVFPYQQDSALLAWSILPDLDTVFTSLFSKRTLERRLVGDMQRFMHRLQGYTAMPEVVYGFKPEMARVQDTVFLSTHILLTAYPGNKEIYALVEKLELYARQQGVAITRPPIVHVQDEPGQGQQMYRLMVGLPVANTVPVSGGIELKRMILGNLLTATITGKADELPQLFEVFEEYKRENKYTSPAIPFMELVTDRRAEPDSGKWITRFCYPVF